jgi:hypothetical protein
MSAAWQRQQRGSDAVIYGFAFVFFWLIQRIGLALCLR